jgi:hypothetical protein
MSRVCSTGGGLVGSSLQAVRKRNKEIKLTGKKNFRIFIGMTSEPVFF